MPIEIKELIIRLTVNTTPATGQNGSGQAKADITPQLKQEIIEECVEKILEILEEKQER
jgi:hypothetical protein